MLQDSPGSSSSTSSSAAPSTHELAQKDFKEIINTLHIRTGYDFREYKKPTLSRRIQRRMGLRNVTDIPSYITLLNQDPDEALHLFKDMLIGVTAFFRDPDAFMELRQLVVAPLIASREGRGPIRVWMPGCSTGEEAYSLSIILHEEFARQGLNYNVQIFATDIDENAVAKARGGRYGANLLHELPEAYLHNYFDEDDNGFAVKKVLRESVTFAIQNVIADPPFSKLDLICCRNLLIYLEASMQNKLLELFHFSLNDDGYLFLGSSESTPRHEALYTAISKQSRIFRKNPINGHHPSQHRSYSFSKNAPQPNKNALHMDTHNSFFSVAEATRSTLLANYAPSAVLINNHYEILYFYGETSQYLYRLEGEPTNDLCAIAASGLITKIRAAVQQARKSGTQGSARARHVRKMDESRAAVTVTALPVRKTRDGETLFVVAFADEIEKEQVAGEAPVEDKNNSLYSQLEYELLVTRQDLQNSIEQLETSNEELKASNEEIMSMNEELQSSNEELETSREELQSLNEELNTVNNQLEEKVQELEAVNNDLSNLLSSTDIATIFLDTHLRIRRFTPATDKIIHLIDSDIGRPLADLALNFRDQNLIVDCQQALETQEGSEAQVSDEHGRAYLRRITLYRTSSDRVGGVVITFTDITDINTVINQLARREQQQALVARFGQEALTEDNLDLLFAEAAKLTTEAVGVEFCKILKLQDNELLLRTGLGWREEFIGQVQSTETASQGGYTLASRKPVIVEDMATETRFQAPLLLTQHKVRSGMSVIIGPHDKPWGVLGVHSRSPRHFTREDINFIQSMANGMWSAIQRTQSLREVTTKAMQLQMAMRLGQMASWTWDLEANTATWDEATASIYGLPTPEEPCSSELLFQRIHPEDMETVHRDMASLISDNQVFRREYRIIHGETGQLRWLAGYGGIRREGSDQRSVIYCLNYDITERKHYEVALQDREEWLKAAKQAADAASEAKSAFLANMSHEIRTPLTAILGYADLLHSELNNKGLTDSYLHKIKSNGRNLLEIINDVLDLSKVEADRIEIVPERFSIKALLSELLSLTHLRASEKELDFIIEVPHPVPAFLRSDAGRVKQILSNIIANAIKFTPHGSVHLVISAESPEGRHDTTMVFRVIDTGIGIDNTLLGKIFDPFEQVDSSIAKIYGGTGLGLTISKRITTLLGGDLNVESEPGKGSTFTLHLPVGSTEDEDYIHIDGTESLMQEYPPPLVDRNQLSGVHVLVVDDIEDVLTLIQQMLKMAGAIVSTASNGQEALDKIAALEAEGPGADIVLMDTMMPVIDGYTAVRTLRKKGFNKPIVALTAAAMSNDRERCLEVGCNDYLSKPVTMEQLVSVLQGQLLPWKLERDTTGPPAKVMIVEDNPDAGEAIKGLLDLAGYRCLHVSHATVAMAELKVFKPDVVLLDLNLPDMDGRELARVLRTQSDVTLIALSGEDLQAQQDELKADGFDAFLQKPVDMAALANYFPVLGVAENS